MREGDGALFSLIRTLYNADIKLYWTHITNKIILLVDVDGAASTDTITEIAADIQGAGTALELQSGGKAIVIAGNDIDGNDGAVIYLVDDSLGAVQGTISADDVVKIGTLATFDVDTLTGFNFV